MRKVCTNFLSSTKSVTAVVCTCARNSEIRCRTRNSKLNKNESKILKMVSFYQVVYQVDLSGFSEANGTSHFRNFQLGRILEIDHNEMFR